MWSKNPIYCTAKWVWSKKTDFFSLPTRAPHALHVKSTCPVPWRTLLQVSKDLGPPLPFLYITLGKYFVKIVSLQLLCGSQEILNKWCLCRSTVLPGDTESETSLALPWFFQSCPSAAAFLALPSSKSWENTLILSRDGIGGVKIPIIGIYGSKVFASEYSGSRNAKVIFCLEWRLGEISLHLLEESIFYYFHIFIKGEFLQFLCNKGGILPSIRWRPKPQ